VVTNGSESQSVVRQPGYSKYLSGNRRIAISELSMPADVRGCLCPYIGGCKGEKREGKGLTVKS
jgi:hypothetical protein